MESSMHYCQVYSIKKRGVGLMAWPYIDSFICHVFSTTVLITCATEEICPLMFTRMIFSSGMMRRELIEHSGTITTFLIFILGQISSNYPEIFISLT